MKPRLTNPLELFLYLLPFLRYAFSKFEDFDRTDYLCQNYDVVVLHSVSISFVSPIYIYNCLLITCLLVYTLVSDINIFKEENIYLK